MQTLTNIVAWLALAVAVAAFYRTGGTRNLRGQIERLSALTEGAAKSTRVVAADVLERAVKLVRGKRDDSTGGDKNGPKLG
jgi:hypothetical protein